MAATITAIAAIITALAGLTVAVTLLVRKGKWWRRR